MPRPSGGTQPRQPSMTPAHRSPSRTSRATNPAAPRCNSSWMIKSGGRRGKKSVVDADGNPRPQDASSPPCDHPRHRDRKTETRDESTCASPARTARWSRLATTAGRTCQQSRSPDGEGIPVVTVDEEIYRLLPDLRRRRSVSGSQPNRASVYTRFRWDSRGGSWFDFVVDHAGSRTAVTNRATVAAKATAL